MVGVRQLGLGSGRHHAMFSTRGARSAKILVALGVIAFLFATPLTPPAYASVSAPSVWGLLAAGEKTAVLGTDTSKNATTLNNGTYFYNNPELSMGFSPNSTITQNTADNHDTTPCGIGATANLRLSWHRGTENVNGGWRWGCNVNLNTSTSAVRAVYQTDSSTSYYPSGPQRNVSNATLLDNGWEQCYLGGYGDPVSYSTITNACTKSYIILAGGAGASAIQLSPPTISADSSTTTSVSLTFSSVTGASSYTANLYTASSGGSAVKTVANYTSGASITGLSSGTIYFATITTIGDNVNYITSGESSPRYQVSTTVPSYTISFNLDGGTGTLPSSVSGTGTLTFPVGSGQSKNGEEITGWSSSASGGGTRVDLGGAFTPNANATFYAVYEAVLSPPGANSGTVGQVFSATPTPSGFTPNDLTYTVASGALHAGLSLDSSTGTISGTPTAGGNQAVTLKATHALGGSATSSTFTISIAPGSQAFTWSPTTSLTLADSGLTLSATLTTGDGAVGYTVVDQGTTGCTVSGSILSFPSTGAGANGCEVRPTAMSTDNYTEKSDAGTVTFDIERGTFALSSPSSLVGVTSSSFTDVCTATCAITGFAPADQVLVVVGKSDGTALSGRVRLEVVTGLSQGLTGYQASAQTTTGHPELAFSGTQAQVNAALATLQYRAPAGGGDENLGISASLTGAAYFAGTGSYYEFVATTVNWSTAKSGAAAATFNGMQGHLATVTSLAENQFITSKVGTATAWLAGTDSVVEGTWKWDAGPEEGDTFWTGTGSSGFNHNTTSPFTYWGSFEPNNSGNEDCLEIVSGGTGRWNDIPCTSSKGYVIEYSNGGGAVLKEASTTFTVGAPTAPLQVTGVSATAGNSQTVLPWSAPDSGGPTITAYLVEQFDPDTSTWTLLSDEVSTTSYTVTGLTNGTAYSFRVSAKNAIGTGTVSATVVVTPAAPAPQGNGGSGGTTPPNVPVVTPSGPALPGTLRQPTPRPTVLQGPVTSPGRGFDPNAGTRAIIGGVPATVTQRTLPGGGLLVIAGPLQLGVKLSDPSTGGGVDSNNPSNRPELRVPQGQSTTVNGGGLLPGSQLQVWLPGLSGSTPKELARVPVTAEGTFEAELSFTASQSETPIPIGRQVMQVTGVDSNGNQTVVDMAINVAQGPVLPELNRQAGNLPALTPGASLATSAGVPTPVTILPIPEQNLVSVGNGQWLMSVRVEGQDDSVQGTSDAPVIWMTQGSEASATGDGFLPGTTASVWMFSEPTLMATIPVGQDGFFTLAFLVDAQFVTTGAHTLQIQGVGEDGFIKAANLGVLVDEVVPFTVNTASGLLGWVALVAALLLAIGLITFLARRRNSRTKRALGRAHETPAALQPAID